MSNGVCNDGAVTARNVTKAISARTSTFCGNRIGSRDLLSGDHDIIIAHGENDDRLRLTPRNKLTITK